MRKTTVFVLAITTILVVAAEVAAEEPIQVLYGCAQKNKGSLRVVDSLEECNKSEVPVSFLTGQNSRRCPGGASVIGFSSEGKMMCSDGSYGGIEIGADCPHNLVPYADLRACDFSEQTFSGDLHGANFENANFYQADFSGADLSDANLTGTNLRNALFVEAVMDGAVLSSSVMIGTNFDSASLVGADLAETDIQSVAFSDADLSGANLQQAQLDTVTALRVRLDDADLTGSTFTGLCRMNLCQAQGADFTDARIYGQNPNYYAYPFGSCQMSNSIWDNAVLSLAGFYGANLTGASMQSTFWRMGNDANSWRYVRLIDANLLGATIFSYNYRYYYFPYFSNTTCPDGSNSSSNGGTCMGHLAP